MTKQYYIEVYYDYDETKDSRKNGDNKGLTGHKVLGLKVQANNKASAIVDAIVNTDDSITNIDRIEVLFEETIEED